MKDDSLNNTQEKIEKPEKKVGRTKVKILILLFLLFSVVVCAIIMLFLIYGGYAKEFVCKSVKVDSVIWNKISCEQLSDQSNDQNSEFPTVTIDPNIPESNEESLIENVIDTTSNAVIGIGILGNGTTSSVDQIIGSGFVISKGGLIVTNRHVVDDETESYYVLFKDGTSSVNIDKQNIFRDPVNDIALIKIDPIKLPSNLSPIPLGDSDNIKLGQTVIAIGNPLGKYTGTVTKGIISGLNREVAITQGFFSSQSETYDDVIQTDAAINPGNSGGPLINSIGEVIGINFATIEGASNLSFALPINRIKQRVTELDKNGKFSIPYMGIEYRSRLIIDSNGESIVGAEITNIITNSPAQKSEFKKGDIIIKFDGKDLNSKTLQSLIQTSTIGSNIDVVIIRDKIKQTIVVTIEER